MSISPLRVLVAASSAATRAQLLQQLREAGHHPTPAADGADALDLFHTGGWDAVLLEPHLAEISAPDLAHAIKSLSPATPLILLCAAGEEETCPQVDSILLQPTTPEVLALTLALCGLNLSSFEQVGQQHPPLR